MGRGLMIFIVGMFIVMGIYNFSSQNRLLSSEEDMARQVHYTMASTTALSALEMAGQFIMLNNNENFSDDGHIWTSVLEDGNASVLLNRNGNDIRLTSTGTTEGVNATIVAEYRLQTSGGMPILEAAMGFYSDNIGSRFDGRPHLINGCDHLGGVSSPVSGDCELPGIAVDPIGNTNIDRIRSEVTKRGGGPPGRGVLGKGTPPSILPAANTRSFVDDQIREANASALRRGTGLEVGTVGNPMLTVVGSGEELRIGGSDDAAGIIIVEEGGKLDLRGNSTFQGLIIIQGSFHTAGTPTIWGSMIVGGEDLGIAPEIRFRGTPKLKYSSEVLNDLRNAMRGSGEGRRMVLQQIYQ